MTRQELQQLADERAADGTALLAAGRFSAAYYLLGYAVECALKACVAKQTRAEEFPDKEKALKVWTHNFLTLLDFAGLKKLLEARLLADQAFKANWERVKQWNESTRYTLGKTAADATALHAAVTDPTSGILTWIRSYW